MDLLATESETTMIRLGLTDPGPKSGNLSVKQAAVNPGKANIHCHNKSSPKSSSSAGTVNWRIESPAISLILLTNSVNDEFLAI